MLAARYAAEQLPGIFGTDDPTTRVVLATVALVRVAAAAVAEVLEEVGEESDLGRAKAALGEAIRLSRVHFEKEERIAFPLAESVLGERALRERVGEWGGRRAVRVAPAA